MEHDINRKVHFQQAPIFDPEDKSGINNTWIYHRAPDGYLFELHSVDFSVTVDTGEIGMVGLFDGHEYTHWNIWPGVESREYLARVETNLYHLNETKSLNGWKCKEYSIGCRSRSEAKPLKVLSIVYYYLRRASREELLEYALKHPHNPDAFKTALRGRTVDLEEI